MTQCRLYTFVNVPSEVPSQLTNRIVNLLQSPQLARYDVTYKVYRKQSEKLTTLHISSDAKKLYVLIKDHVYALSIGLEEVILKLNTWTLRQTMKINGSVHDVQRLSLGSIETRRVRTGLATQGPSSKGLVIEIEDPKLENQLEAEHTVLDELMGPIQQNLLANASKTGVTMQVTDGHSIRTDTDIPKTVLAYFEMFSRF